VFADCYEKQILAALGMTMPGVVLDQQGADDRAA
jgi:hypothetical protein